MQHFYSVESFVKEMRRIIQPGGTLVIATHFATGKASEKSLSLLFPVIDECVEAFVNIDYMKKLLKKNDFQIAQCDRIGQSVYNGYHKWVGQIKAVNLYSYNFYEAYERNYIDYFLLKLC